jgi:hypothetical protein
MRERTVDRAEGLRDDQALGPTTAPYAGTDRHPGLRVRVYA